MATGRGTGRWKRNHNPPNIITHAFLHSTSTDEFRQDEKTRTIINGIDCLDKVLVHRAVHHVNIRTVLRMPQQFGNDLPPKVFVDKASRR